LGIFNLFQYIIFKTESDFGYFQLTSIYRFQNLVRLWVFSTYFNISFSKLSQTLGIFNLLQYIVFKTVFLSLLLQYIIFNTVFLTYLSISFSKLSQTLGIFTCICEQWFIVTSIKVSCNSGTF
jgi:hypothetical protein